MSKQHNVMVKYEGGENGPGSSTSWVHVTGTKIGETNLERRMRDAFVTLEGSDKQVSWAEDIRRGMVEGVRRRIEEGCRKAIAQGYDVTKLETTMLDWEERAVRGAGNPSAKFWIDNRETVKFLKNA